MDKRALRGYLSPARLGQSEPIDVLTPDGEHEQIPLAKVRAIYFVREFSDDFEPERKAFLSRPKLDGLWVRLRFADNETLEGVIPNDLLSLIDNGLQITPPDLNSTTDRIFKGAYDFNASKKGRLLPVKSVGEALESASAKYFRESELWVKTKLPVAVVVTDNVLPKDEFKMEKVDRRRKDA